MNGGRIINVYSLKQFIQPSFVGLSQFGKGGLSRGCQPSQLRTTITGDSHAQCMSVICQPVDDACDVAIGDSQEIG
jgi:hypothetical protein